MSETTSTKSTPPPEESKETIAFGIPSTTSHFVNKDSFVKTEDMVTSGHAEPVSEQRRS